MRSYVTHDLYRIVKAQSVGKLNYVNHSFRKSVVLYDTCNILYGIKQLYNTLLEVYSKQY